MGREFGQGLDQDNSYCVLDTCYVSDTILGVDSHLWSTQLLYRDWVLEKLSNLLRVIRLVSGYPVLDPSLCPREA